jgi:steroid 5-alpha reductase family enzyme
MSIVYFFALDVQFWLLALLWGSTWLIDPYWQFIPLLTHVFYAMHPAAETDCTRFWLATGVLCVWATRLTYNYFRREEWLCGHREDWRFTDIANKYPKHWWWMQFFAAFASQHVMLFTATLPLWAVSSSSQPLGPLDIVATIGALTGITVQGIADSQLRTFMLQNEYRSRNGQPKVLLLNSGLWYYSRHPNYFGEQLFWWSMWLFAYNVGAWQTMVGAVVISSLFFGISLDLVETRMLANEDRRALFKEYQRTTSSFLPLPKFGGSSPHSD